MTRMRTYTRIALGFAFVLALMPGTAFASTGLLQAMQTVEDKASTVVEASAGAIDPASIEGVAIQLESSAVEQVGKSQASISASAAKAETAGNTVTASKLLTYDPADIAAIGTQEGTGHSICCPSFSCAYADAVIDGTVNDHEYYTCSCCTWTDWGGGGSSDRCVGTDEELLREAYDQISAGKPTVIHVAGGSGEHWIALIGYQNVTDPDHLTLSNFIALDPWDGKQLNAGSKYSLYGDGCEHVSSR